MFKACDYCRHRKKRCRTTLHSARCSECDHLDLPCEFSPRVPSLKRRQTSRQVVARLGIGGSGSVGVGAGVERETWLKTAVHDGDCQVRIEELSGMIDKALLLPRSDNDADDNDSGGGGSAATLDELYQRHVQPFLPFLPDGLLARVVPGAGSILEDCVHIACALLSFRNAVVLRPSTAAVEAKLLQRCLTLSDAAGALLLMPCLCLDTVVVDRVFACVEAEHARGSVPLPVLAGVLSCHAWRQLIDVPCQPVHLPPDALPRYTTSLDNTSFAHHYLQLADLALRFGHQRATAAAAAGLGPSSRETQLAWARLEYDCLLWQIRLPSQFLDLRDELPATAESLVLHSLSNLLLLSLYGHVLLQPPNTLGTLGTLLALRPVPGVLHFMCALARSVFICPRAIVERWAIVVDIQAVAAHTMLRLWRETQFENCRAIMNLWWHDAGGAGGAGSAGNAGDRYRFLAQQVRAETGPGPWRVDGIDGYSVFWTFRDLRTLTLEMICGRDLVTWCDE